MRLRGKVFRMIMVSYSNAHEEINKSHKIAVRLKHDESLDDNVPNKKFR